MLASARWLCILVLAGCLQFRHNLNNKPSESLSEIGLSHYHFLVVPIFGATLLACRLKREIPMRASHQQRPHCVLSPAQLEPSLNRLYTFIAILASSSVITADL